jgi:hypothetical protein
MQVAMEARVRMIAGSRSLSNRSSSCYSNPARHVRVAAQAAATSVETATALPRDVQSMVQQAAESVQR